MKEHPIQFSKWFLAILLAFRVTATEGGASIPTRVAEAEGLVSVLAPSNSVPELFPIPVDQWRDTLSLAKKLGHADRFLNLLTANSQNTRSEIQSLEQVFQTVINACLSRGDYPLMRSEFRKAGLDWQFSGTRWIPEAKALAEDFNRRFPERKRDFAELCKTLGLVHYAQKKDDQNHAFHKNQAKFFYGMAHFLIPEEMAYHREWVFALKASKTLALAEQEMALLLKAHPEDPYFRVDWGYLAHDNLDRQLREIEKSDRMGAIQNAELDSLETQLSGIFKVNGALKQSPRGLSLLGLAYLSRARIHTLALRFETDDPLKPREIPFRVGIGILEDLEMALSFMETAFLQAEQRPELREQERHALEIFRNNQVRAEALFKRFWQEIERGRRFLKPTSLSPANSVLKSLSGKLDASETLGRFSHWLKFQEKALDGFKRALLKPRDWEWSIQHIPEFRITLAEEILGDLRSGADHAGLEPFFSWCLPWVENACERHSVNGIRMAALYAWADQNRGKPMGEWTPAKPKAFWDTLDTFLEIYAPLEFKSSLEDKERQVMILGVFLKSKIVKEEVPKIEVPPPVSLKDADSPKDIHKFLKQFPDRMKSLALFATQIDPWNVLTLSQELHKLIRIFCQNVSRYQNENLLGHPFQTIEVFKTDFYEAADSKTDPGKWTDRKNSAELSGHFRAIRAAVAGLEHTEQQIRQGLIQYRKGLLKQWKSESVTLESLFIALSLPFIREHMQLLEEDFQEAENLLNEKVAGKDFLSLEAWKEASGRIQDRLAELREMNAFLASYAPLFTAVEKMKTGVALLENTLQTEGIFEEEVTALETAIRQYAYDGSEARKNYDPAQAGKYIQSLERLSAKTQDWLTESNFQLGQAETALGTDVSDLEKSECVSLILDALNQALNEPGAEDHGDRLRRKTGVILNWSRSILRGKRVLAFARSLQSDLSLSQGPASLPGLLAGAENKRLEILNATLNPDSFPAVLAESENELKDWEARLRTEETHLDRQLRDAVVQPLGRLRIFFNGWLHSVFDREFLDEFKMFENTEKVWDSLFEELNKTGPLDEGSLTKILQTLRDNMESLYEYSRGEVPIDWIKRLGKLVAQELADIVPPKADAENPPSQPLENNEPTSSSKAVFITFPELDERGFVQRLALCLVMDKKPKSPTGISFSISLAHEGSLDSEMDEFLIKRIEDSLKRDPGLKKDLHLDLDTEEPAHNLAVRISAWTNEYPDPETEIPKEWESLERIVRIYQIYNDIWNRCDSTKGLESLSVQREKNPSPFWWHSVLPRVLGHYEALLRIPSGSYSNLPEGPCVLSLEDVVRLLLEHSVLPDASRTFQTLIRQESGPFKTLSLLSQKNRTSRVWRVYSEGRDEFDEILRLTMKTDGEEGQPSKQQKIDLALQKIAEWMKQKGWASNNQEGIKRRFSAVLQQFGGTVSRQKLKELTLELNQAIQDVHDQVANSETRDTPWDESLDQAYLRQLPETQWTNPEWVLKEWRLFLSAMVSEQDPESLTLDTVNSWSQKTTPVPNGSARKNGRKHLANPTATSS